MLAGCWDRRELEEKSASLATGVDVCPEGEGCNLISTRQFAIPGRIPLGPGGVRTGNTVFVISSPGQDGPDTAKRAQSELHRVITFGHTRLIVLSEAFARRGTEEYFDYVRRVPEARRVMWIAVSEGPAEAVIRSKPALERVPALYLNDMFDDAVKAGRLPKLFWGDFLVRLSNQGEEAVAPLIRMNAPNEPQLAGLAVFRGYRMVGKLSPEETATYMQVQGVRNGSDLLAIELPGGQANLRVYGRVAGYKLRWVQGRIHADVEIELESELVSLSPDLASSDPDVVDSIERLAAQEVTRKADALATKLQKELGADILALGERVRAYLPAVWSSLDDWPSAFADARIRFQVKVHVRRTGMGTD